MPGTMAGCGLLIAVLATCSLALALQGDVVLYEEAGDGHVVKDYFPAPPPLHLSSGHAHVVLNPSPRLAPCDALGAGRHAVLGNCSQYLECLPESSGTETLRIAGLYRRRVVQCPEGLWFSAGAAECTPQYAASCPLGQLVPNPARALLTCESDGVHVLPGCGGFYTCRHVSGGMERYTYTCGEGESWNGESCAPKETVECSERIPGADCTRTCVAGVTRLCSFTFVIEEFASMSIYCNKCPFTASDCNLPGCIPGGGVAKPVQTINRMLPGPEIQVCKGDTLEVEVQNRLPAGGVTIHWHGLQQTATPHMDGVPYLTQCPIHPGNSFLYRMTADISGTHIYHSHVGHQESDGMHGVLIVREPRAADPVTSRYDEDLPEHRVLVWHWFERYADVQSVDQRLVSLRQGGFSFLVNGKGAVTKHYDSYGTAINTPLDTFYVTTGKRYRFRSIFNAPVNCPVQLSIDGHVLDILSSDGRPIQPLGEMVDSLVLTAGERTDFVPYARPGVQTAGKSFYVRVRGLNDCDDSLMRAGVHQSAYLRYDLSAAKPQGSTAYAGAVRAGRVFNSLRTLPTTLDGAALTGVSLVEATDAGTPTPGIGGTPSKVFYVDTRFRTFIESGSLVFVVPQMNNITYANPPFPPLTQPEDLTGGTFCRPGAPTNCVNGWCTCPQLIEADRGDLVEIVMFDPASIDLGHPFHLHGYTFRVVAMSSLEGPLYPERLQQMNEAGQIAKKFDGPLKDTVTVPGKGYVVLRFFANNPGYWILHCHITEHMAQGMALVLKVGSQAEMVPPPANFPRCGNFA